MTSDGQLHSESAERMKAPRMQRVSFGRRLLRQWMVLLAVVVIAVSGFTVYRLHGIFASQDVTSTPNGLVNDTAPFNPKRVVIEVFGPPEIGRASCRERVYVLV